MWDFDSISLRVCVCVCMVVIGSMKGQFKMAVLKCCDLFIFAYLNMPSNLAQASHI
jgi:hypothetical protein